MTLKEYIEALSKYPEDTELGDIKTSIVVEKDPTMNRIHSAYLANHRITGNHPWGKLHHLERQTDLNEVAKALLNGLKLGKMDNEKIKNLAQSYVDELFAHEDMSDQENIENKNLVADKVEE